MTSEAEATQIERAKAAGFSDPKTAFRLREALRTVVQEELGKMGPDQQVARCMSIDLGKLRASVWVPGDPEPIGVNIFPHMIPNDADEQRQVYGTETSSAVGPGAVVIIETIRSQPYITNVLSSGNFAYRLSAAGLQHKSFNATMRSDAAVEDANLPTVQGLFGTAFSLFVPGNTEFGDAVMIGPMTSDSSLQVAPGTFRVTVTTGAISWEFEFTISDKELFDQSLYSGAVPIEKWLRILPKHSSGDNNSSSPEVALDVGYRGTHYRNVDGSEFWMRLSSTIPDQALENCFVHINSMGTVLNFGEYTTGRILAEKQSPLTAIAGVLGFHQRPGSNEGSNGIRMRDDYANRANASSGPEPRYSGSKISQGPWVDASLRLARDLAPTWGCNGHFVWSGSVVSWTGDLVFSGVGPSIQGLLEGRLNLPMPANGTKIGIYPSNPFGAMSVATVTVASGAIPLAAGQTLYAIIPNFIGNGGATGYYDWADKNFLFMIVDNETYDGVDQNFKLPEWVVPIFHRSYSGADQHEGRVLNTNVELIDTTQYSSEVHTATVAVRANTTANVLMTTQNMRFKNNCAYRVKLRTAYRTTTANSIIRFGVYKGTTTAGTQWIDFGKYTAVVASHDFMLNAEAYLVNVSGADINTQVVLADQATTASTISFPANANVLRRYFEIDYAGPAAKYANQGNAIT